MSHSRVTAPRRRLVILHGAFGAGRNWTTLARRLVKARPEWAIVLADLRLHGGSCEFPGVQEFPPPHTLETAAADVAPLAQMFGVPFDAVLGHSRGGKVALSYAGRTPQGLRQVWVVDATPAAGPPAGGAWQMRQAVRSLPAEFSAPEDAAVALGRFGFAPDVAQWMTANLLLTHARYRWRLDFAALEQLLCDFFQTDLWGTVTDPPPGVELHFIKASSSDALSAEALHRLESLAADHSVSVHTVEGGHWIHADNLGGVIESLAYHLP